MQIKITDLYDRFPFFSYSLFQKYKVDNENKPFFKSKKDLYLMLEANYYMEYKSRKKIIKYLEFRDIAPFAINKLNLSKYHLTENPIKSLLNDYIALDNNEIELSFSNLYRYSSKYEICENLEKKLTMIKEIEGLDKFDNWVILEIIINFQRYKQFLLELIKDLEKDNSTYFNINLDRKKNLILDIYDGSTSLSKRRFLFKRETENNLIVFEYIKKREKKLSEPKWVSFSKEGKDIYLDHKFNYLIIDYEKHSINFNFINLHNDKLSKLLFD